MSIFEPPPEPEKKPRRFLWLALVLAAVFAAVLWFSFRYHPEKKAATRLFDAIAAGDLPRAYQLWKPSSAGYTLQDFRDDWGEKGYYGPVKSYKIEEVSAPCEGANSAAAVVIWIIGCNSSELIVTVRVSPVAPFPQETDLENLRRTKSIRLWVDSKDKSFSFPP
ncbi:MAG: hypothetical protein LAN71_14530 [Acidobacteriia bacterium]|nr:hypothetical protein [Terriglobia bacterium]